MQIILNGKTQAAGDGATVAELLVGLKLEPIRVAVEINEELVPRRAFEQVRLRDGDRIEVVTFVGGG
jgi:thiamine biosynthesis protein ThiS